MTGAYALAIDIGGTTVKAAIVDVTGAATGSPIRARASRPTVSGPLPDVIETCVAEVLARRPDQAGAIGSIGIGVPEYVFAGEPTSALVVGWTGTEADRVRDALVRAGGAEVEVGVDADVRCGARGEYMALPERSSLLYVSWGTGVSMSLVLPGGDVWAGARGEALALGEWSTDVAGGARLEDVASGAGIRARYAAAASPAAASATEVAAAAMRGDHLASRVLDEAGTHLSRAVRELVYVLDPAVVVLGGGLGASASPARSAFERAWSRPDDRPGWPRLRPAVWGPDSGLVGAARLRPAAR